MSRFSKDSFINVMLNVQILKAKIEHLQSQKRITANWNLFKRVLIVFQRSVEKFSGYKLNLH